jgi:hypothetical protein
MTIGLSRNPAEPISSLHWRDPVNVATAVRIATRSLR